VGPPDDTEREDEAMATKTDFTEDEWATLQRGVTGSGFLVSMSDRGFFDTFKESGAIAKHLSAAHTNSPSALVRDIAKAHGTGFGLTSKPDEVEAGTLEALRASVALLTAKSPDDVDAYRSLVVAVAESVSKAAKGGDEVEAATIARIREAVGA
jgi:hypothetical protein